MLKTYRTSLSFPAHPHESWIVKGYGGEASERWTVRSVTKGDTHQWITVLIEQIA